MPSAEPDRPVTLEPVLGEVAVIRGENAGELESAVFHNTLALFDRLVIPP